MAHGENNPTHRSIFSNICRLLREDIRVRNMIDFDSGLLDELRRLRVFNDDEIKQIMNEEESRTDRLLGYLTLERYKKFLVALFNTKQEHVNNFFIRNGRQTSPDETNWPLPCATELIGIINEKRQELTETIDWNCGLSDELLLAECITAQHRQIIAACDTSARKTAMFLVVLHRRSINHFNSFILCLKRTKQYRAASLIEIKSIEDDKPLEESLRTRLYASKPVLIKLIVIDAHNRLLTLLVEANCITKEHRKFIESADLPSERSSRLLQIIMNGSKLDFDKFVDCLGRSHQEHLCCVLKKDKAVVAHLVVRLGRNNQRNSGMLLYCRTGPSGQREVPQFDTNSIEASIVNVIMSILQNNFCDKVNLRPPLSDLVILHRGVQLVAVDDESYVIGLYFMCLSLSGLQHLNQLCISGRLRRKLDEVFHDVERLAFVNNVRWNASDFNRCIEYMFYSEGMPILSDLHALAQKRTSVEDKACTGSVSSFERMHYQLIELTLIRAACKLFELFKVLTPTAEAYALVTLCAVCHVWWWTLIGGTHATRSVKRSFKRICPFICKPNALHTFKFEHNIVGIAALNNRLYVACQQLKSVQVFESCSPFGRLADIPVPDLNAPSDIAVCSEPSRLYIADYGKCAIFVTDLSSADRVTSTFVTQCQPVTLSARPGRITVVPKNGNKLFIYGEKGNVLHDISLPKDMIAAHAVETVRNTYIIGRRLTPGSESMQGKVSEVDSGGRVVRSFNIQHPDAGIMGLGEPYYLASYDSDNFLVADRFDKRIVLLNRNMQIKRVLINSIDVQPWRLCLSNHMLFLACDPYQPKRSVRIYEVM
jgi:hypothetical protein